MFGVGVGGATASPREGETGQLGLGGMRESHQTSYVINITLHCRTLFCFPFAPKCHQMMWTITHTSYFRMDPSSIIHNNSQFIIHNNSQLFVVYHHVGARVWLICVIEVKLVYITVRIWDPVSEGNNVDQLPQHELKCDRYMMDTYNVFVQRLWRQQLTLYVGSTLDVAI